MRTSTIVVTCILGLAATPLALHLIGGSSSTTKNWIKTLHGGGPTVVHVGSGVPEVLQTTQDKKPAPKDAAPTLAGKWTVTINGTQGNLVLTMVLKQEGTGVTGTITNPHGEGTMPVVGELANRSLTLTVDAATDRDAMHLAFKGAVKDDGSLGGTMTSAMGESTWTGTRIKDND